MLMQSSKKIYTKTKRMDVKRQALMFDTNEPYIKILDEMNVLIIIFNSSMQIVYANKAYLKFINIQEKSTVLGKRLGESISCSEIIKYKGGCQQCSQYGKCDANNIILSSIEKNEEGENEVAIIRKTEGFHSTLNLFQKVVPIQINGEKFYLTSFMDATDSIKKRTMERIFFHDLINTAGALKGILNMLKKEIPLMYQTEVAQVEGMFGELINEIESQKQMSAAESDELFVQLQKFNSREILVDLKRLYDGYTNSINKKIKLSEECISMDLENDTTILKRVIGNMIKNALEATKVNETVIIGCEFTIKEDAKFWVKNSEYISDKIQNNIFKRAFSTKAKGRGNGTYSMKFLGEKYLKGCVNFTSSKEEGTCFYIEIPTHNY